MKIYTSYWAQVRNFPSNLVGLNTTIFPPKWRPMGEDKRGVLCIDCPPFKPGRSCENLCRGTCEPRRPEACEFLKAYKKQLNSLDFAQVMQRLHELAAAIKDDKDYEDIDFALIVFEKYDNPCSERWPIQQWFKENGVEIEEWTKENITSN